MATDDRAEGALEAADARRFRERARLQGYRIEEFREMHDRRMDALKAAGRWPPRLRPLEQVTEIRRARTTEEGERDG